MLREAARFGLKLKPGTLPSSTRFLYAAIGEALDPHEQVEELLRRRIALDTTNTLCINPSGKRLVTMIVHGVKHVRCFALYDVPRSYVARAFRRLAIFCGCGIPTASLKDLANPVRDEHIRRVCGDGTDYLALARCHDLAPGAPAQSSTRAEPLAAAELPPNSEEEITAPFLKVHAIPAGGPLTRRHPHGQGDRTGTRHQEPRLSGQYQAISERARPEDIAHARWGVRRCTDLGWPSPTLKGAPE